MKFIIDNWMLIAVALASGGMLLWPTVQGASAGGRSRAHGAVQLINRERAVVVDVSEPEEFAAGHVSGAKNVPLGQLEQRLPEVVKNKSVAADPGVRHRRARPTRRGGRQETRLRARPKCWPAG